MNYFITAFSVVSFMGRSKNQLEYSLGKVFQINFKENQVKH